MIWLLQLLGFTPRAGAHTWKAWWSTKLALLSSALGAAAVAFSALPPAWQALFPDWLQQALAIGAVATAFVIPFFAAAVQPKVAARIAEEP